jgi:hypothetical protein
MPTGALPPPPVNDKPGSFTWLEWYRQLRNYVSTSGSVPWYIINFAGSNITDIALRSHQNLQSLQGGGTGEMYHLTAAQYAALTAGPHNTLSGLQGGTASEYYHLTQKQNEQVINTVLTVTASTQTITSQITIIVNFAGTCTLTLPAASSYTGRTLTIKTITANTVVSASSNVVPLAGGSAGTAIVAATAGKWATLTSDGTSWVIMAAN